MLAKLIKKIFSFFSFKSSLNIRKFEYFKTILYKECQNNKCMFFYHYVDNMLKDFDTYRFKTKDKVKIILNLSVRTNDHSDEIFNTIHSTMHTIYDDTDYNINGCFKMSNTAESEYDNDRIVDIYLDVDFDRIKLPKVESNKNEKFKISLYSNR